MNSLNPRQMVVEGWDDLFSVVGLMRHHVEWPIDKRNVPVTIHMGNGAEEILRDGYLSAFLKSSAIRTFGVMLDADTRPRTRYDRIRVLCKQFFPDLPNEMPKTGLVVSNDLEQKRFGVWIMPDNSSDGCLETFLRYLIPDPAEKLWIHATDSVETAKKMGCACRDHHVVKANLYTWLAWNDPPGQSPGQALTKKILDPHSPSAAGFVEWFRNLYQL